MKYGSVAIGNIEEAYSLLPFILKKIIEIVVSHHELVTQRFVKTLCCSFTTSYLRILPY